ncbi:MAG: DUF308 domain-containing protein [Odoribacter sp.]|nr:DUF308 domain-containing protein [Odoribacter sp.]
MQIVYATTSFKGTFTRAILAIVVGAVLVIWPDVALRYIIMFIGAMFLVTGLVAFIISNKNREEHRRSLVPFSGIGSMALGLLLLCLPTFFTTIFMFVLGFMLVIAAIGQFVALATARQYGMISPLSYLFPVLILVAGIVVLFDPFASAESVFILFGITAIFYGITDLINQSVIRKVRKNAEEQERLEKMETEPEVVDAEFEEL